jgi:OOP family OmpA-OmpF porin
MLKKVVCLILAFASGTCFAQAEDILTLENGAVVLTSTEDYNEKWSALCLIDGTSDTGWCTKKGASLPLELVIELPGRYQLETFSLDNTGADAEGISCKDVEILASGTSAREGFVSIGSFQAKEQGRVSFNLADKPEARWLKLVIKSNYGSSEYTELMELEATGALVGQKQVSDIAGIYDTNYKLMEIRCDGNTVEGCYDWGNGSMSGSTDGRVVRFRWWEDDNDEGSAIMVLASDGSYINGLWYRKSKLQGIWFGTRVTDGRKPCCGNGLSGTGEETLKKQLEASGRAILYGIYFDSDSDKLKAESEATLNSLLKLLQEEAVIKLNVVGHTDSQNSDSYNLDLSQRRAKAVVTWLIEHGIDQGRLVPVGKGEAEPVADNSTPQGRALNRRVEVTLMD